MTIGKDFKQVFTKSC